MHTLLTCGESGKFFHSNYTLPAQIEAQSKLSHEATPEIWQETYVSAILRAVLYSDDPVYWLDAYRKLDPITSPEGEIRFLQAAEALFLKGTYPLGLGSTKSSCSSRLAGRI
jgi:hypothetical protein